MERIGHYEVLGEIARGGMGMVLRARDPDTQEQVAVKLLLDPGPELRQRFLQEAQALQRLRHAGIAAFRELGRDSDGRDFVVMELVEGESLQARLRREGPLPLEQVRALMRQLCGAVAYAHRRGVLHRDIKPGNVLVTGEGQVKLTDFGLGKVVNQTVTLAQPSLTRSGESMGTPAYMPPEQALGEKSRMGPASDVYALGATLYALLTGRPPFAGASLLNVVYAVLEKPPLPPSRHRPEVPPELDALVMRCLAKDPQGRFADAAALLKALEGEAPGADAQPARASRGAWLAAGALAVGLAFLAAVRPGGGAQRSDPAPPSSSPGASPSAAAPLAGDPRSQEAEAAYRRGKALLEQGRAEEALRELSRALALRPDWAQAYTQRGAARGRLLDWRGACEDFDRAIGLRPDAETYCLRGVARAFLGDGPGELADYTEALRLDPNCADAYSNRGGARARQHDWEGVVEDCSAAIRLEPDSPQAYHNRAAARGNLGDLQGMLADCNEAIRLRPDYADAYYSRGVGRGKLGDLRGAVEDFEHVLALRPDLAARVRPALDDARRRLAAGE